MRTMHPVLMVGYHGPNDALLPDDEYFLRLKAVRAVMADMGLDRAVIYGDCDNAALLTYLTNFFPRNRWAVATLSATDDPVLYVAGGTRDLPFAAAQTRTCRVEPYDRLAAGLPAWLDGCARVGTCGFDHMLAPVHRTVAALVGTAAVPMDTGIVALLAVKRPREVAAIVAAADLLGRSSAAMTDALSAGASPSGALIEAERTARRGAAHDVRLLASFDDGRTLEPFLSPRRTDAGGTLIAYMAVRSSGYWAAGFVNSPDVAASAADQRVTRALDRVAAGLRPGMDGRDVLALAGTGFGGLPPHPVLGSVLGHGLGLGLSEWPVLNRSSGGGRTVAGGVYLLSLGVLDPEAGGAIRSCIVHLDPNGAPALLWRAEPGRQPQ